MKIIAYEVRDDEREHFDRYAGEFGADLILTDQVPTMENASMAAGCEGVTILGQGNIDAALLDEYKKLGVRCLTTRTIGYDHIDIAHARAIGLPVCNAFYEPNGVAEYAVMLMLLCIRHYKAALWRAQVNDYSLPGLYGREMRNLTVGILGTGRIGTQLAKILSGFGCRILGYDQYQGEASRWLSYTDLDTLYRESDIISVHLNLNEQTYHMIDSDAIARMKDGVILINCARGALMDPEALIAGIEQEKIGSLGLDCFESEEGIYHLNRRDEIISNRSMAYLRQFPNVVMTQHMAFYTDAAVSNMVRCGIEGICSVLHSGTYKTLL
ncbi:MAG: D-isomer specific 2-hydroxyacid dehydrogenase family protein [Lachnospiraceae bacterium]|nr:D-isomer specific 2-hydroxyacid dehydrogenase family protein [Lachnospiraceae bacterium]